MRVLALSLTLTLFSTPVFATLAFDPPCGRLVTKRLHTLTTERLELVPAEEIVGPQIHYSVRLRDSTAEIGRAQIIWDQKDEISDMGLELDKSFLEQHPREGYGTELKTALLKFGFEDLGAETVYANVLPSNDRSLRLHVKLGFLPTGEGVQFLLTRARWREVQEGSAEPADIAEFRQTRYLVASEYLGETARQYCLGLIYNDLRALKWNINVMEGRTSFAGLQALAQGALAKISRLQIREVRKLENLLRSIEIYRAAEPLFTMHPGEDILPLHTALSRLAEKEPLEIYLVRLSPLLSTIEAQSVRTVGYKSLVSQK